MNELKFIDVGEGITEGHVQKWLVKDGDQVKEDEPIMQIETDKAVVSIPAAISGTIKIMVPDDTIVHVGDVMAYIGTPDELKNAKPSQQSAPQEEKKPEVQQTQQQQPQQSQQPVQAQQQQTQQPSPQPQQQPTQAPAQQQSPQQSASKEPLATPYVRKLARDMNIDLSTIKGSGPGGRVTEDDLKKGGQSQPATQKTATASSSSPTAPAMPKMQQTFGGIIERVPMSSVRKAIARNMELSATIPRAAHMDLINATNLYMIVKKEKQNAEKLGVKLTFLPYIIKATIWALKENPRFNSSYDKEKQEVIMKKYYNIGLAAEGEDGLRVIVIKDADKKSILDIAKEIDALHKKVMDKTISVPEMSDSTFTITNIGSLGGGFLSVPMINYPEVGILGVHLIRSMPIVVDDQVKIAKVLPFSIAFDHRVVDGAEAVLMGNALIKYLEDPDFLQML